LNAKASPARNEVALPEKKAKSKVTRNFQNAQISLPLIFFSLTHGLVLKGGVP